MKGRLPSKFQLSSFFSSSFIVEGLWMCVFARAGVCVWCLCVCD